MGLLAGVDEVGRGPLAGPVIAACVLLESDFKDVHQHLKLVDDSKKLNAKKRQSILTSIFDDWKCWQVGKVYLAKGFRVALAQCSVEEIDHINILQASLLAMNRAMHKASQCFKSEKITFLIDGPKAPRPRGNRAWELIPIIKGDQKEPLIALASIAAKEYRDQLMERLGERFPHYGLGMHKGYPTQAHKEAIKKYGVTPIHRKSFKGVREFCREGARPRT